MYCAVQLIQQACTEYRVLRTPYIRSNMACQLVIGRHNHQRTNGEREDGCCTKRLAMSDGRLTVYSVLTDWVRSRGRYGDGQSAHRPY